MPINHQEAFVKITTNGITIPHHQKLGCILSGTPTPGTEPLLVTKGGTPVAAETAVSDFLDIWDRFFSTSRRFGLAEVFSQPDPEEGPIFLYGWNIGRSGTALSGDQEWVMGTFSFKTIGGNPLKLVEMEGIILPNTVQRPPFTSLSAEEALADWMTGDDAWVVGADDNYAFGALSVITKYSDVLRKRAAYQI